MRIPEKQQSGWRKQPAKMKILYKKPTGKRNLRITEKTAGTYGR